MEEENSYSRETTILLKQETGQQVVSKAGHLSSESTAVTPLAECQTDRDSETQSLQQKTGSKVGYL